jgi:hypothetical protein
VEEKRNACRDLVWKPEGKGRLERSGSRWENNIITDSKEINRKDVGWINLVLGKKQMTGCLDYGSAHSGSMKSEKLLDWLTNY